VAVTTAVISGIASVGAAVVSTINQVQNQKAIEAQNEYNAQVAEEDARRTQAESAMNRGLLRANARKQIASGQNAMAGAGMVGSSPDAAIVDAYFNLNSDLAAMKYQYDNTAIKYLNESANYRYNKAVAKMNAKGALLGGMLKTTAAAAKAYKGYSDAGGKYGFSYWSNNGQAVDTMQVLSASNRL
jgi:hypothetical protein